MNGILVKPDLIPAIVEGRKTQTRRVIEPQPESYIGLNANRVECTFWKWNTHSPACYPDGTFKCESGISAWLMTRRLPQYARYHAGETVYIKEAWAVDKIYDSLPPSKIQQDTHIYFKEHEIPEDVEATLGRWRSPLHLPSWFARHFITILAVRAERLQEITDADCEAEGVKPASEGDATDWRDDENGWHRTFRQLWDSINPTYSWESNPWVFPYEFEFVKER